MRKSLFIGAALIAVLICIGLKVLYFGVERRHLGNVGSYEIVACKTWHSFGGIISNDARGGFYRIYDSDGQKVFELFSTSFAFDHVMGSDSGAEFHLDSGVIEFWRRPD
jgi:hypothetical protein